MMTRNDLNTLKEDYGLNNVHLMKILHKGNTYIPNLEGDPTPLSEKEEARVLEFKREEFARIQKVINALKETRLVNERQFGNILGRTLGEARIFLSAQSIPHTKVGKSKAQMYDLYDVLEVLGYQEEMPETYFTVLDQARDGESTIEELEELICEKQE